MNLTLPFTLWPDADREAFQKLFAKGSPLDDHGPYAHWRDVSRNAMQHQYGIWLKWVSQHDPDSLALDPVWRATPERLRAWCLSRSNLAPSTLHGYVGAVVRLCKYLAPDKNWTLHQRILAGLYLAKRQQGSPRKSGRVLSSEVLLEAGQRLVRENMRPILSIQNAVLIRDGAMICLLTLIPMRRRALSELAIGTSLRMSETHMEIRLDGAMTKNDQPWEALVPEASCTSLQVYLDHARPVLAARSCDTHSALWLGRSGDALTLNAFTRILSNRTKSLLGKPVSPHLFRDAAATTLARASSASARMITPVLGHSTTRTAEQHYIHADTIAAGRKLAEALEAIKTPTASTAKHQVGYKSTHEKM